MITIKNVKIVNMAFMNYQNKVIDYSYCQISLSLKNDMLTLVFSVYDYSSLELWTDYLKTNKIKIKLVDKISLGIKEETTIDEIVVTPPDNPVNPPSEDPIINPPVNPIETSTLDFELNVNETNKFLALSVFDIGDNVEEVAGYKHIQFNSDFNGNFISYGKSYKSNIYLCNGDKNSSFNPYQKLYENISDSSVNSVKYNGDRTQLTINLPSYEDIYLFTTYSNSKLYFDFYIKDFDFNNKYIYFAFDFNINGVVPL